ncbi:protein of unknown function [Paraburkholderia dioscoreae]|uniref:Uncharacterized protein n=1 Tax=Paraburkholderia dioscoreae TaxID=2604047 RepID=A0A5Q4YSR1_9BURK|nr:protein of unknown function [Paraburkholderia dioscoreae]
MRRPFTGRDFHASFHRKLIVESNYSNQENNCGIKREMSKMHA